MTGQSRDRMISTYKTSRIVTHVSCRLRQNFLNNSNLGIRDNTHNDVYENCPIFKIPHPSVHLRPKLFHRLDLGRPISN